jgi:hypothetical protein
MWSVVALQQHGQVWMHSAYKSMRTEYRRGIGFQPVRINPHLSVAFVLVLNEMVLVLVTVLSVEHEHRLATEHEHEFENPVS